MQITAKPELLAGEVAVYEKLKTCQNPRQIAKEMQVSYTNISYWIKGLIYNGMIERTGIKKHYVYVLNEREYKIVAFRKRQSADQLEEDTFLQQAMSVQLDLKQLEFLNKYRKTMLRTELAKQVGITKLQLNFILDRK